MQPVKIGLADFKPLGAQNSEAHRQVEQKVRHPEERQKIGTALGQLGKARTMADLPFRGGLEIGGLQRFKLSARMADAGLEAVFDYLVRK